MPFSSTLKSMPFRKNMMLHGEFFFLTFLVPDLVMHEHEGVHVPM